MEFPQDFRCPISMELMKEPVTISTGVTYDRQNIEKWFFTYKKKTCPATMQRVRNFDITPNHTLKRLILDWQRRHSPLPPSSSVELVSLLETLESLTPFKISPLKKLRSIIEAGSESLRSEFKKSRGYPIVVGVLVQVLVESSDFATFRACEEALGVLNQFSLNEDGESFIQILSRPDCMKSIAILLQKGGGEARFLAVSMFKKLADARYDYTHFIKEQGNDFFKSLLELVSDEICTKASSCALQLLIDILSSSKKSRLKAVEAGAICTLIELLPDSNKSKSEKIMFIIKLLCECAEGRVGFVEHSLGIAAVSKKIIDVSEVCTRIGVKVLWLISSFHPTERVVEEMVAVGATKKLVALLHLDGGNTTKDRVVKMLKLHGNSWKRSPCFPSELKGYLGMTLL